MFFFFRFLIFLLLLPLNCKHSTSKGWILGEIQIIRLIAFRINYRLNVGNKIVLCMWLNGIETTKTAGIKLSCLLVKKLAITWDGRSICEREWERREWNERKRIAKQTCRRLDFESDLLLCTKDFAIRNTSISTRGAAASTVR